MYRIAVCDDEKSSAAAAAELLAKYRRVHPSIVMDVDIFNSSIELLGAIEKNIYDNKNA